MYHLKTIGVSKCSILRMMYQNDNLRVSKTQLAILAYHRRGD